jgi:pimeloyl-ACP methyl ester carboxylesterase
MSVLTKRTAEVRDTTMAYVDEGGGRPIVLLHGNPTSSYVWRNVIPHLADRGRVIAPDLVGHGDSAKLPGTGDERYSLAEHQAYLDALLDQLGVDGDAVLVGHDWGGPLGFDWARRHADAVAGIAYMETIVRPLSSRARGTGPARPCERCRGRLAGGARRSFRGRLAYALAGGGGEDALAVGSGCARRGRAGWGAVDAVARAQRAVGR